MELKYWNKMKESYHIHNVVVTWQAFSEASGVLRKYNVENTTLFSCISGCRFSETLLNFHPCRQFSLYWWWRIQPSSNFDYWMPMFATILTRTCSIDEWIVPYFQRCSYKQVMRKKTYVVANFCLLPLFLVILSSFIIYEKRKITMQL